MSTQLRFRRGNTAQTAAFTGALAEVTVDTDKNVVVVHDGFTAGGFPSPTLSFVQAAFDVANNVAPQVEPSFSTANNAYNKANSANVLAQSAFDKANTGALIVKDEGITLTSAANSINFTGNGVITTTSGNNVTVNVKSIYDYTLDSNRFVITDGNGTITDSNNILEISTGHMSVNVRTQYVIGAGMAGEYYQSWIKSDGTSVMDVGVYAAGYAGHSYTTMEWYAPGTGQTMATFNSTGNVSIYGTSGPIELGTNYDNGRTLFVNGDLEARDLYMNVTHNGGIHFTDNTYQNTAAYPLVVKEEGSLVANTTKEMNFVGSGVTATASGNSVTITVNTDSAEAAFARANAAYDAANSAASFANGAFITANSAASFANGAFARSNAAYGKANSSIQNTGDNSITNGSLTITNTGGTGLTVTGNVFFNNDLSVSGNLIIRGNTTSISANNLVVDDTIIYLANNNSGNTVDIGIIGNFLQDNYQHTGIIRDHVDGTWKFFSNVIPEPTTTVDFTNAYYDRVKTGDINLNGISEFTTSNVTASTTSATTVYTFNATTYRTAKMIVQMKNGSAYHSIELIMVHDGTTVYLSQYGEIKTGSSLGSLDAYIDSGSVILQVTATNNNTNVKVHSTLITS